MTNKKLTIISVSLLSLFMIATFSVLQQKAQENPQLQQDEATVIKKGSMTERQKKHSKLYERSDEARNLISGTRDVLVVITQPYMQSKQGEAILSQKDYVQKMACKADTIVLANVKGKTSQLTLDQKTVFTDYDIEVQGIIKKNQASSIEMGKTVVLTTSGGTVRLDDRTIEIVDKSFRRIKTGEKHLFFLKYLNESDSYQLIDAGGDFLIFNNIAEGVNESSLYLKEKNNVRDFTNDISYATQQCSEDKK